MINSGTDRVVVLATADIALRQRICSSLTRMRWRVREAKGGAEAMAYLEEQSVDALLLDAWLPDLEVGAFSEMIQQLYPELDLLRLDGSVDTAGARNAHRHELLQALREAMNQAPADGPAWAAAPVVIPSVRDLFGSRSQPNGTTYVNPELRGFSELEEQIHRPLAVREPEIPGLIGRSESMRELGRLIRLVAPHSARVLIEGETGTGKEIVAKAVHKLSSRANKSLVILNCAAIPEALLEAELFGHTRGAFTGAVQSRVGRIEAAHGGTLFLDEIGEMPLQLQAKLLRFLENGELQRIGDNETIRVDVRVVAATHQHLDDSAAAGRFRLDLLHRLAVFPLEVPSLRDRIDDIPLLAEHFLSQVGKDSPRKRLTSSAAEKLELHSWPGNVRELGHVLQRAVILAGDQTEITNQEIRMRRSGLR